MNPVVNIKNASKDDVPDTCWRWRDIHAGRLSGPVRQRGDLVVGIPTS